jgi:hypothetical protein
MLEGENATNYRVVYRNTVEQRIDQVVDWRSLLFAAKMEECNMLRVSRFVMLGAAIMVSAGGEAHYRVNT